MNEKPCVSVIIPTFNRASFVSAAINSILNQSLQNFEIIVVNDGSSDNTIDIVEAFNDPRIIILNHTINRGISQARNTGLNAAQGKYIAWLDSDDISRPSRLAKQYSFLEKNTDIAMVGSCAGLIDVSNKRMAGCRVPPMSNEDIKAWLLFRSAFQQSSLFGRSGILKNYAYQENMPVCEDFDVNIRISQNHSVCNINSVLIDRRVHPSQISWVNKSDIRAENLFLVAEQFETYGINASYPDIERHALIGSYLKRWENTPDKEFLGWAEQWFIDLRNNKSVKKYFDQKSIDFITGYFWIKTCLFSIPNVGYKYILSQILRSPLSLCLLNNNGRKWIRTAIPVYMQQKCQFRGQGFIFPHGHNLAKYLTW